MANRPRKKTIYSRVATFLSKYGLVHVALQVGPYLIDWMSNSELRIRSIYSRTAMLFLYPNNQSFIDPTDMGMRRKIAQFLFDYREKKYTLNKRNCQYFVDKFLLKFNIDKKWTRN